MPIRFRYTAEVQGVERPILSVRQTGKGDLVLGLWGGPFANIQPERRPRIQVQRVSVHPSPASPDGNLLKFTTELKDGRRASHHHFTRAIKTSDRFAFLLMRYCCDLSLLDAAKPSENVDRFCIGPSDPERFTLVFSVFVSSPDREFLEVDLEDASIHSQVFGEFRLTLVWTYVSLRPSLDAWTAFPVTIRPEDIADLGERASNERQIEGYNEQECLDHLGSQIDQQIERIVVELLLNLPRALGQPTLDPVIEKALWRLPTLFKMGSNEDPEYRKHVYSIREQLGPRVDLPFVSS